MSATAHAQHSEPVEPVELATEPAELGGAATEYATRGARRDARSHLRMVMPLRPERASRGVFLLLIAGTLVVGMIAILVINTSLAQGAFTVTDLQARQAALTQQEQALSQLVAAAAAPDLLEDRARALGMVPSETPVFLRVPSGKVVGKPKAAPGGTGVAPRLLTPANATAAEGVDNTAGTDLPVALGPDYDPAAADAAAMGAEQITKQLDKAAGVVTRMAQTTIPKVTGEPAVPSEASLWGDTTVIDVTGQVSDDSGLVARPVR